MSLTQVHLSAGIAFLKLYEIGRGEEIGILCRMRVGVAGSKTLKSKVNLISNSEGVDGSQRNTNHHMWLQVER